MGTDVKIVRILLVVRFGSRTDEPSSVEMSAICCHSVTRLPFSTPATQHPSTSIRRLRLPLPLSRRAWRPATASPRRTARPPTTGRRPGLTPPTRRHSTRCRPGPTAAGRRPVRRRRCPAARLTAAVAAVLVDCLHVAIPTNRTRWRESTPLRLPGDVGKRYLAGYTQRSRSMTTDASSNRGA